MLLWPGQNDREEITKRWRWGQGDEITPGDVSSVMTSRVLSTARHQVRHGTWLVQLSELVLLPWARSRTVSRQPAPPPYPTCRNLTIQDSFNSQNLIFSLLLSSQNNLFCYKSFLCKIFPLMPNWKPSRNFGSLLLAPAHPILAFDWSIKPHPGLRLADDLAAPGHITLRHLQTIIFMSLLSKYQNGIKKLSSRLS